MPVVPTRNAVESSRREHVRPRRCPRRLGELLRGRGEFSVFPLPFPIPEYAVKQHWHERYHNDPGNRWLRGLISELVKEAVGTSAVS